MMVAMQETAAPVVLLVGLDSPAGCDRCCAGAVYVILLPSGGQLTFCGHHTRAFGFMPALTEGAS
jgi:hypothetical protein